MVNNALRISLGGRIPRPRLRSACGGLFTRNGDNNKLLAPITHLVDLAPFTRLLPASQRFPVLRNLLHETRVDRRHDLVEVLAEGELRRK